MLEINEIYRTILGESRHTGRLCTIVRLSGCHRRCAYCDSAYAFGPGRDMSVEAVLAEVEALGARMVLVTGGEPLLQDDVRPLMRQLADRGRDVVLETAGTTGTIPLDDVPRGVCRVVDIKAPGSGISDDQIDWKGIGGLEAGDELKIVCRDRADYLWARDLVRSRKNLPPETGITLSVSHGELDPSDLADWIVADALDVRFQMQLHKAIWPDREREI